MQLITYNEFINSGLPVASDISEYEVEASIIAVEEFYLKNRITDEHYIDLLQNPLVGDNPTLLGGGIIDNKKYAGLKRALYHLVFAYMLINGYRVTRYSAVEKQSEFSVIPDRDDLTEQAKQQWEIGEAFVREVQVYYGIDPSSNSENNLGLEPLLF